MPEKQKWEVREIENPEFKGWKWGVFRFFEKHDDREEVRDLVGKPRRWNRKEEAEAFADFFNKVCGYADARV